MSVNIEELKDRILDLDPDDYMGICIHCGAEHYYIEPDAVAYECSDCGELAVYGLEELLLMLY
jgi:hypothetical protein